MIEDKNLLTDEQFDTLMKKAFCEEIELPEDQANRILQSVLLVTKHQSKGAK